MFSKLRSDIACILERDPAARSTWEVLTCYPGLHAIWIHKLAHWFWNHRLPWLGRMPKSPQYAAGTLTEPPESVPSAKSQRLFDTADAEPLDDPPGMRSAAAPFRGVPKCQFFPTMLYASSSVMVFPIALAPAFGRSPRSEET